LYKIQHILKEKILENLREIISGRIQNAKTAMDSAQEAANSEGKSSAGDKYETSRAMGQIDRDMYARQMMNAVKEMEILQKIDAAKKSNLVGLGSLVNSSNGYYFVAISIGNMDVSGKYIGVISQNTPVGQALMGKKAGDYFSFLGQSHQIISVE
jgi:transcription elongation GreA/GreB family factor